MGSLHDSRIHKWFATSPPVAWTVRQLRELLIGSLKQGPIPQHVAFVMDGNRRFARNHHIETVEGHNLGFESLARILEVCYKTGVKVVTVYAFSIENFKRSKHEVDALMSMAKVKLEQIAEHGALLDRYGASIRVLGQRDLMRKDVLAAVDTAVAMTAHNKKAVLNVCFPYTSRDEITTAVMKTVETYSTPIHNLPTPSKRTFSESHITQHIRKQMLGDDVEAGAEQPGSRSMSPSSKDASNLTEDELSSSTSTAINPSEKDDSNDEAAFLDPESICAQTLTDNMMTADSPPLDLLIRTSGVERLSDFMLWQCHENTSIVFLKCLWPEFDLWQFLPVLVEWQWQQKKLQEEQQRIRGRPKSD
ncbi:alkyl transferase [Parastagonospora nodorum]|uniref:Alkyl transferase n=1 Tax=Phaeosphaeria nodorum (strain SN15 / ATCC MYA-4574 / FGSC 10173) TaxID=321614 RepID=A0A7U2F509_PHANO|nr:alkyl transferase [Parastagonospora nodorum]QRC98845.1 alkyl transferase [Parastagonospora nodorum SN15]KAH3934320.1 alkyl transferase [Parastagonospora nodorum]KAH3949681.1 alkyl transferase [Parastagonospora nodorum]KAH3976037.1 alkyl transferase [Parastagonospora nodorum]